MRRTAILIAASTLLVVAGLGAAAWVAVNDKDHPSTDLLSNSPPADKPEPAPAPPTTTEQQPDAPQPAPTETEPQAEPPAAQSPAAPKHQPRKTHFNRERRKAKNDQPQRQYSVPPAREFTGEGNAHLGTVDVTATSILKWKTKGHFEVHFGREDFPIIAPTKSGQLVLPPFRFEQVRVIAAGRWKITISPQ
jgi:hypothetical protein